jgi:hypothetical protein
MVEARIDDNRRVVAQCGEVVFENLMIAANANTVFNAITYNEETRMAAYAAGNNVMFLDLWQMSSADSRWREDSVHSQSFV